MARGQSFEKGGGVVNWRIEVRHCGAGAKSQKLQVIFCRLCYIDVMLEDSKTVLVNLHYSWGGFIQ